MLRAIAVFLIAAVAASGCGDPNQNCALPCYWGVDVHNATGQVVYFVLREEPRETTRIETGETAAISYVMPRYGDLSTQMRTFRAFDGADRVVFCKRVSWRALKDVNRVTIVQGEIEC